MVFTYIYATFAVMKQAMIFAAGLGTRLKPLTDTMPKALVRVGEKPLLLHVIDRLKAAGVERIVVNVHHFADQIIDYLKANGNFGLDIRVSDEREQLLETGGGIKKARHLFDPDSPILIHNVDIFSNADLEDLLAPAPQNGNAATLLVSPRQTSRYLLFNNDMRLMGWTNIKTGEVKSPYQEVMAHPQDYRPYAFSGIHVFDPLLFPMMDAFPERFGIIDFYLKVCDGAEIHGVVKEDLQLLDVGKIDLLDQAELFLNCHQPIQS